MQMVAFRTPSGGTSSPTVTSVSPNSGSAAGGTAVTITGTNFVSGATVAFGGHRGSQRSVGEQQHYHGRHSSGKHRDGVCDS